MFSVWYLVLSVSLCFVLIWKLSFWLNKLNLYTFLWFQLKAFAINPTVEPGHLRINEKSEITSKLLQLCPLSLSSSIVTEGPETCQHCDAARHRPHRQVAHTGLRVPGETNKTSPLTSCMTHVLFCAQMLKWNVFYIMIIHEPLRSRGGLYRNNCCRWCACGVPVAFLLFWQSPPLSLSISLSLSLSLFLI